MLLFLLPAALACARDVVTIDDSTLTTGTWGADGAGMIVDDSLVHVHIGCTFGNFVPPDSLTGAKFSVSGSYVLRAYPVLLGPELPAQFAGTVSGRQLTLTVAVNDTVEKKLVILGPVTITHGVEPRIPPCPICRTIPSRQRIAERR
jgi:hypothetical protein